MRCTRCGRSSESQVCVLCTAHMSQAALEKIIELAEAAIAAQAMTGSMRRICCVCRAEFGTTPCIPAMDGQVTHGLCGDACAEMMVTNKEGVQ